MSISSANPISPVRFRRAVGAVAVATASATVLSAAPASAGDMSFTRDSGRVAVTQWLEVGTLPGGVPGNIHFGTMLVEDMGNGRVNAFGEVLDLTCPEGVIPAPPAHGEPSECTEEGARFIDGGTLTFTMDRRFSKATLTGTLRVFGHDGPSGTPAVNMTWTGVGSIYKSVETARSTDDGQTFSERYAFSGRAAQVSGNIGAMIFDDVAGEYSSAELGTYRLSQRSRG